MKAYGARCIEPPILNPGSRSESASRSDRFTLVEKSRSARWIVRLGPRARLDASGKRSDACPSQGNEQLFFGGPVTVMTELPSPSHSFFSQTGCSNQNQNSSWSLRVSKKIVNFEFKGFSSLVGTYVQSWSLGVMSAGQQISPNTCIFLVSGVPYQGKVPCFAELDRRSFRSESGCGL